MFWSTHMYHICCRCPLLPTSAFVNFMRGKLFYPSSLRMSLLHQTEKNLPSFLSNYAKITLLLEAEHVFRRCQTHLGSFSVIVWLFCWPKQMHPLYVIKRQCVFKFWPINTMFYLTKWKILIQTHAIWCAEIFWAKGFFAWKKMKWGYYIFSFRQRKTFRGHH